MASFIDLEVGVDDEDQISDDKVGDNNSDIDSFTDDNVHENDNNFYLHFDNVETNVDDVLAEEYKKSLEEDIDDCSNLCQISEEENEVDDFQNSKQRIDKFKETLFPKNRDEEDDKNSFINVILHAIRFHKEQKTDLFNFNELQDVIDQELINALNQEKYEFLLDLQKFQKFQKLYY